MAGHTTALRHLGVNALFLQPRMGGIETYVLRLVPALLDVRPDLRVSIFVNDAGRQVVAAQDWSPRVELVHRRLLGLPGTRAVTEATVLGALASRRGVEVLHSVALLAPLRTSAASVVTIADMTWLRQSGSVPLHTRLLWRTLVFPAARRAERLIAHSHAAREEIVEDLGVPAERVDVVAHGPGADTAAEPTPETELRARLGLGAGPIILAVSALLPHKNVGALVEAMAAVRRRIPDAVLVVPANPTPLGDRLRRRASELGMASGLVLPGWVSSADLEGLYASASCFAFPSLREGFGLPVLEAMKRGLAVACSDASAVPEVAGTAALLFDPTSVEEIAEAVSRLLNDAALRAEVAQRGRRRAATFTWRRAAAETLGSYERALAAR